jgi:NCS1 family nucleobase:cation symporter-1
MTSSVLSRDGMPSHEGDMSVEGHGFEPIPESARYGSVGRVFTVWFTPNLVPAAFFLGTLAAADFIGLGFWTSLAAIVIGNLVGSVLVGLLATMGPKTGMAQMPLARLAYGKSIVVPGLLNWISCIGWDGINSVFGAAAISILTGLPFVAVAMMTALNPKATAPLFTTSTGHLLIAIALVMMALGGVVLNRMVKPRAIA